MELSNEFPPVEEVVATTAPPSSFWDSPTTTLGLGFVTGWLSGRNFWVFLVVGVLAWLWFSGQIGGGGAVEGFDFGGGEGEGLLSRLGLGLDQMTTMQWVWIGVGLLVLWWFWNRGNGVEGFEGDNGNNSLNWKHGNAAAYYDVMVKRFGAPEYVVKQPGGVAVWTEKQLADTIFVRHELHDESIHHCRPFNHHDYLYSFVNYSVEPTLFDSVLSLSGSLSFDPLKKWLRARCDSLEANIATLTLATKIGEAQLSLEYVQDNDVYAQWVAAAVNNPANVQKQYEELVFNIAHQRGNPKNVGYSAKSYPSGCRKADTKLDNQYADSLVHQVQSHSLRKV